MWKRLMTLLVASLSTIVSLWAADAPNVQCVTVEAISAPSTVVNVTLRNTCSRSIAALSIHAIAPEGRDNGPSEFDFTVGLGVPAGLAPSGGVEVGLFSPGSVRKVVVDVERPSAALQVRIEGVIYEAGEEEGDTSSLRTLQDSWRHRVTELRNLELEIRALQAAGSDELAVAPYLNRRLRQLTAQRTAPGLDKRGVREKIGGESELRFFQKFIREMNRAVQDGKITQPEARTYIRTVFESRLKAHRDFIDQFNAKGGKSNDGAHLSGCLLSAFERTSLGSDVLQRLGRDDN